ncbi:ECF-type sigma factor [Thiolapillus sp.]
MLHTGLRTGAPHPVNSDQTKDLPPKVYEDLKRLARIHRSRLWEKGRMGTRSIVHEAYLKLIEHSHSPIEDSQHFLLVASRAMRSILVDNARHWRAQKRGGEQQDIPLEKVQLASAQRGDELIELDNALTELSKEKPRLVDVVVCRFFGGLNIEETAQSLNISPATVKRDWAMAKTLLYQRLFSDAENESGTTS